MMVPKSKKMPYMILAEVEFLHPGPLLQQQLTAVEPKQQAIEAAQPAKLKIAPMPTGGEGDQMRETRKRWKSTDSSVEMILQMIL